MADANYDGQAKIYIAQGATDMKVASGGDIDVESGGDIIIEGGGEIETQSGSYVDFQSGTNFYFADTTAFTSDKLMYTLYSLNTITHWGDSGTGFSGVSIIAPAYGYHMYSASTGISKASLQLPSAHVGARLILDFSLCVVDANASIFASGAAVGYSVGLLNYASVLLSSFEVSAAGRIELVCETENIWAIVYDNGSITERAIA